MSAAIIPFQDLAQRIQQHEAELNRLRLEFQERQNKLTELIRRKEELQEQLQCIESDMEALGEGSLSAAKPAQKPATSPKLNAMPVAKHGEGMSFPQYLVQIIQKAKRPVLIKELADEVVRRKYPTKSKNIRAMVETRIYELVKQKVLQRADDQSGFELAIATPVAQTAAAKKTMAMPKNKSNANGKATSHLSSSSSSGEKPTLHQALMAVLAKSSQPVSAQELSTQLLANGYETKSRDLKSVIWVSIGKMKNIQRVKGKGYRLKKGKVVAQKE